MRCSHPNEMLEVDTELEVAKFVFSEFHWAVKYIYTCWRCGMVIE